MSNHNTISRRRLLGSALAAGVVAPSLSVPAIAQGRAKLNLQSLGGAYEKILRDTIIPEFEKQYGIDVVYTVEDDVAMLPKLRAARGRPIYDVVTLDNPIAIAGMDLWASDQSARMSNIPAIYKSSKPPATANYGSIVYEYALVHDRKKLPHADSWLDLWKPGLVVGVPHITQAYGLTFLYIAAMLHGGNAKDLNPGFAAIKSLSNFKVYKNVSEGLNLFQQKEVDAALFYGHRAQQMIDMGLDIAKSRPKEGNWGQRTGSQIPKNTANMEGSIAWVNNCLSVSYQTTFAAGFYSPTNRNVVLPPELAAKNIMGEQQVDSIREVDWESILPQRDSLIEKWTREIG